MNTAGGANKLLVDTSDDQIPVYTKQREHPQQDLVDNTRNPPGDGSWLSQSLTKGIDGYLLYITNS